MDRWQNRKLVPKITSPVHNVPVLVSPRVCIPTCIWHLEGCGSATTTCPIHLVATRVLGRTVWDAQNWPPSPAWHNFVSTVATSALWTCKVAENACIKTIFDAIWPKFYYSMLLCFWPPKSGIPMPHYLYMVNDIFVYHLIDTTKSLPLWLKYFDGNRTYKSRPF